MPSKQTNFKDQLIKKIDEYTDKAFEAKDEAQRNKYRDAVKILQKTYLMICDIE